MAFVIRSYKFVGTNNAALQRYGATSASIIATSPATTLEIQVDETDASSLDEYMESIGWVFWNGEATEPSIIHELVVASTAGKNNYPIPIGNYFLNAAGETTLELDTGSGFVPQVFGVDYKHFLRSSTGTPASVVDAAIGFSYGPAVTAGWTFRFTWKERIVPTPPIVVAKVLSSLDYTIQWLPNSSNAPNAVTIPASPGMAIEFWRQTFENGGRRGSSAVLIRSGRRYVPYYRGAAGMFDFDIGTFSPSQPSKRARFKVCYYNPATGARSRLSNDTIVVCSNMADGVNGRRPVRTARSVWIE